MLDKLIELLSTMWEDVWCFNIIQAFEGGIRVRFGKFNKLLGPGLAFKIPFIDHIHTAIVVDDTIAISSQKLTTKDGKTITITGMVLYKVDDVRALLLEVNNPQVTIQDVVAGIIAEVVIEKTYEEILEKSIEKLINEISKRAKKECKKWGVNIEYVRLTDMSLSRSLNLFNNDGIGHL